MAEIIINISACYEEVGWEGSYVSTAVPSEWIKKINDVRGPMSDNNLHAEEAYSLFVNECGTFYNKIVPNKADSRGGFIQVSIIVPVGYRVLHPSQVISAITQVLSALPKETAEQELFFEKGQEQINAVKEKIAYIPANVELTNDYTFATPAAEVTPSTKAAYHVYKNEEELIEWFRYPHQDEHAAFKTVFFISPSVEPGSSAVALNGKRPQKVYTVENQSELFYMKEGTSFDLPLRTHLNMEPKTYKVIADGNNDPNGIYVVEGQTIYVYEGKVNFHRQVILQVLFPVSEKKADNFEVPTLTLNLENKPHAQLKLTLKSGVGVYPRVYETSFDYELCNEGKYSFSLGGSPYLDNLAHEVLSDEQWKLPLAMKKRVINVELAYNDKVLASSEITTPKIEVKEVDSGKKLNAVEQTSFQTAFNCEAGKKYSVTLKCQGTPFIMAKEVEEFTIDQDTPVVRIKVRNKPKTLYIRLIPNNDDDVVLTTTTYSLDADANKYHGYKVVKKSSERILHGESYDESYKIEVVPAKFKRLFIVMTAIAAFLLVACISIGILFFINNGKDAVTTNSEQQVQVNKKVESEKPVVSADSIVAVKDSIPNDSSKTVK